MRSFLLAAFAAVAQASLMTEVDFAFIKFISDYDRKYLTTEQFEKHKVYFTNFYNTIQRVNNDPERTHTAAINHLADRNPEDFWNKSGTWSVDSAVKESSQQELPRSTTLPASVDWRSSGCLTTPKDQGSCEAGYAFAAVGALEFGYCMARRASEVVTFSAQQFVDCAGGCSSEFPSQPCWAYMEAHNIGEQTKTIAFEDTVPYTGSEQDCSYSESMANTDEKGYRFEHMTWTNPSDIKTALQTGPVATWAVANNPYFYSYRSGVLKYDADQCNPNPNGPNHGMLIVGYSMDQKDEVDHWIVKNSWGESWGEDGYIRVEMTDKDIHGTCFITYDPSYPIL